jgi:hypothetical protein
MRVKKPIKVDSSNYPKHRCGWGFRNPKNHLTDKQFTKLIMDMLASEDRQHITCPGCGRSIYLSMRIELHNKPGMHSPKRPVEHWEE